MKLDRNVRMVEQLILFRILSFCYKRSTFYPAYLHVINYTYPYTYELTILVHSVCRHQRITNHCYKSLWGELMTPIFLHMFHS